MAKYVFVLTGLLVVLMAAGRAGIHADSSLDGPVIPMPLAEVTGPHPDLVTKSQPLADSASPTTPPPAELVSTIEMPGTAFRVVYLFQYDHGADKPGATPSKNQPLSVVVWKAIEAGTKVSPHDLRARISENSAAPSMTGKAVYTLQPDYKLVKLALTNTEIDHLFDLLQAAKGEAIAADALWKGKVAGQLKEVEWLDDGPRKNKNKNKDKQAKERSAKTGKIDKGGKPPKTAQAHKSAAKTPKAQADAAPHTSHSSRKAAGA
jgi:hypothetical protein